MILKKIDLKTHPFWLNKTAPSSSCIYKLWPEVPRDILVFKIGFDRMANFENTLHVVTQDYLQSQHKWFTLFDSQFWLHVSYYPLLLVLCRGWVTHITKNVGYNEAQHQLRIIIPYNYHHNQWHSKGLTINHPRRTLHDMIWYNKYDVSKYKFYYS